MRFLSKLLDRVKAARAPVPETLDAEVTRSLPTLSVRTPGTDELIQLPALKLYKAPPTPAETMAEGRRMAWTYAKKRTGNPELSWKHAKLLIDRWEKEERAVDLAAAREASARRRVQGFLENRATEHTGFPPRDDV